MTDIVERLRLLVPSDSSGAAFDAVNEIDRLTAENERLRAAIEDTLNKARDANKTYVELFVEVCRELRAALKER